MYSREINQSTLYFTTFNWNYGVLTVKTNMLHLYSAPLFEWYYILVYRLSLLEKKRTQSSHQEIIAVTERLLTDGLTDTVMTSK